MTVDWVVLTAAAVGLSLTAVFLIQAGATDTSTSLGARLTTATVPTIVFD